MQEEQDGMTKGWTWRVPQQVPPFRAIPENPARSQEGVKQAG